MPGRALLTSDSRDRGLQCRRCAPCVVARCVVGRRQDVQSRPHLPQSRVAADGLRSSKSRSSAGAQLASFACGVRATPGKLRSLADGRSPAAAGAVGAARHRDRRISMRRGPCSVAAPGAIAVDGQCDGELCHSGEQWRLDGGCRGGGVVVCGAKGSACNGADVRRRARALGCRGFEPLDARGLQQSATSCVFHLLARGVAPGGALVLPRYRIEEPLVCVCV